MRASDLLWIVVIVGGLALITYSFIKDELRLRRLRQSLKQIEKNPWDPVQMTQTITSDPELVRHLSAARRAELDQLAQRLAAQKDIGAVTQAMKAAFPEGIPNPGDVDDQLLAHPERVHEMFSILAAAHGESAPSEDRVRDALAELQQRHQEEMKRYAAAIPLTLRPKAANSEIGSRRLIGVFVITLLLVSWLFIWAGFRHHPVATGLIEVVLIALWAFLFIRRSLYLRRGTLFVDETQAGYTTAWGGKKAVDRALIDYVYLSKQVVIAPRGGSSVRRRVFLVSKDERPLLRMSATYWSWDDMRTFAATLGVPLRGSWTTDETGDELRRRLPGSISWWAAHPNIFWTLVMIPFIPALILLLIALSS